MSPLFSLNLSPRPRLSFILWIAGQMISLAVSRDWTTNRLVLRLCLNPAARSLYASPKDFPARREQTAATLERSSLAKANCGPKRMACGSNLFRCSLRLASSSRNLLRLSRSFTHRKCFRLWNSYHSGRLGGVDFLDYSCGKLPKLRYSKIFGSTHRDTHNTHIRLQIYDAVVQDNINI